MLCLLDMAGILEAGIILCCCFLRLQPAFLLFASKVGGRKEKNLPPPLLQCILVDSQGISAESPGRPFHLVLPPLE